MDWQLFLTIVVMLFSGVFALSLAYSAGFYRGYDKGRHDRLSYLEQRHDYTPSTPDVRMNHYVNVLNQAIRRTDEEDE